MDDKYIKIVYDQYVAEEYVENLEDTDSYYMDTEEMLLKRLEKYKKLFGNKPSTRLSTAVLIERDLDGNPIMGRNEKTRCRACVITHSHRVFIISYFPMLRIVTNRLQIKI